MSIYNNIDYRKNIKNWLTSRKKISKKFTLGAISEVLRVQTPYLSKVFNGHAHFNSDQLWQLCEYLGLNEEETRFMLLCLEYDRSTVQTRKEKLFNKIKNIQKKNLETSVAIETDSLVERLNSQAEYYLDPLNLIVHMAMLIKKYQSHPQKLATSLGRNEEHVRACIEKLLALGILDIKNGKYLNTKKNIHLKKTSSLFRPHQSLLRQLVLDQLMRNYDKKEFYNLAITFTGDEDSRDQIQREFMTFLKKTDEIIDNAAGENVYQLNFDLFPWLN